MQKDKSPLYCFIASMVVFLIAASFFMVGLIKADKQVKERESLINELQIKNDVLEKKVIEISDHYNELEVQYDKLEDNHETLKQENEELKKLTIQEAEEVTEAETPTEEVTAQAPKKEEPTTAPSKKPVETTEEVYLVETETEEVTTVAESNDEYFEGVKLQYSAPYNITDNKLTATKGVVYYNGHKECYYTQTLLPGEGLYLPGRHVAEDGTIRDGDGYICVAANLKFIPRYTKVMTTLGPGKVYDTGCAYGTVDIYTDW